MDFVSPINSLMAWLWAAVVAVFTALWDMLTDVLCWLFEQVLSIAVAAVGVLDVSGITNQLSWFASIPEGVGIIMAACGFGTAFGIITAALTIRFAMQLIPFVRLGS